MKPHRLIRPLKAAQTFDVQNLRICAFRGLSSTSACCSRSASDKLFEDAAREEAELESSQRPRSPSRLPLLENQHENWDGDERMEDAILRMLVDKYKPLRTGSIQTAEQKIRSTPPRVSQVVVNPNMRPSTGSWATEPLLPSSETHRPWHTEFKLPSHATASIKHASLESVASASESGASAAKSFPVDDKERRREREERKKLMLGGRLVRGEGVDIGLSAGD